MKATDSQAVNKIITEDVDIDAWIADMTIPALEDTIVAISSKKRYAFKDTAIRAYAKTLPMLKDLEDHTYVDNLPRNLAFAPM